MSPKLIKRIAAEVYGMGLANGRCEALSQEQERVARSLWAQLDSLGFDTAPWDHAATSIGFEARRTDDD